ncbi:MAG: hypothetical protein DI551_08715, partial [Micavibrio aeruginosavorus]
KTLSGAAPSVAGDDVEAIAHEAGHNIDEYFGRISESEPFRRAFESDIARLKSEDEQELADFMKRSGGIYNAPMLSFPADVMKGWKNATTKQLAYFLPAPYSAHTDKQARYEAFAEAWARLSAPETDLNKGKINDFRAVYPGLMNLMEDVRNQFTREIHAIHTHRLSPPAPQARAS